MCNIIAFSYRSKTSYNLEQKGLRIWTFRKYFAHNSTRSSQQWWDLPSPHPTLGNIALWGKEKMKLQFNVIFGGEGGRNCVLLVFEVCVLEWNMHLTMFSTILSRIVAFILSSHWDARSAGPSLALKWFCKTICVIRQMRNYQKSLNFLIHESKNCWWQEEVRVDLSL